MYVAVFNPSPAAAKLFGEGYAGSKPVTTLSIGLFSVLFAEALMSYVRMQRSDVGVEQSGTSSEPVPGLTNSVEFLVIVVPPITNGFAGSGTKYRKMPLRASFE